MKLQKYYHIIVLRLRWLLECVLIRRNTRHSTISIIHLVIKKFIGLLLYICS